MNIYLDFYLVERYATISNVFKFYVRSFVGAIGISELRVRVVVGYNLL